MERWAEHYHNLHSIEKVVTVSALANIPAPARHGGAGSTINPLTRSQAPGQDTILEEVMGNPATMPLSRLHELLCP